MIAHLTWTSKTFPKGTSKGALLHAHREIDEVIQDIDNKAPHDQKTAEYADVMFCLVDSAHREGISIEDIVNAGWEKLKKNRQRMWKDNGDGSYSHIKE